MGVHYDCKQHQVVCGKFWTVIISLISFPKFWNKNAHTSNILLSDTNVIFLPLGRGLFFSRYSLSSADKTEGGKDMFECQLHDWQTPLK